jgi:peptidase C25-like protein
MIETLDAATCNDFGTRLLMVVPRTALAGLLLIVVAAGAFAAPGEMLILTPGDLREAAQTLARHRRAEGMKVRIEIVDGLAREGKVEPQRLKTRIGELHAEIGEGLRYLLLMGDAPARGDAAGLVRIPPKILPATYADERWAYPKELASDIWYGMLDADLVPEIEVGRLPADDIAEATAMVNRILAYEGSEDFTAWRKSLRVVAGTAGFGATIDALLEATFRRYITKFIDPAYDVTITYASPTSPYTYAPWRFPEKVVEQFNAGSLVTAYVGHGRAHAFGRVRWRGKAYPTFRLSDARRVEVANGSPIVVIIACSTGHFDHPNGDCISEVLMKQRRGPVAVFSSTRISQPYADAIAGRELIAHLMAPKHARIGDSIRAVRAALAAPEGPDQRLLDGAARVLMGAETLAPCREDTVHLYNLFGDPSMVLGYPRGRAELEAPGKVTPGQEITVTGTLDREYAGVAVVTLEVPRGKLRYGLLPIEGLEGDALARAMAENWKRANDLVIVRRAFKVDGDSFATSLKLPAGDYPADEVVLKLFLSDPIGSAVGAKVIRLRGGD